MEMNDDDGSGGESKTSVSLSLAKIEKCAPSQVFLASLPSVARCQRHIPNERA